MVSIIIPTFNRLSWLRKCLAHLDSQKYDSSFEVIVIDDGSTDAGPKLVELVSPTDAPLQSNYFFD